jgi:ribose/xylose/arabinose/galactoside ABC-type transport system permease subunit
MISSGIGIVAMPMALLLTSGEFDLSVGSVYALVPCTTEALFRLYGVNVWVGSVLGILLAILLGLVNGFFVVKVGVQSFIVTMATWFFYGSLALIVAGGLPESIPTGLFYYLGGYVGRYNFSIEAIWLFAFAVVFYVILEMTKHGNWSMATGSNRGAATVMGVNTGRVKMINFVLTSTFAGLIGILDLARMSAVTPTGGSLLTFETIAAAVIGGTSLSGGSGSIAGTLIGSILLGMVFNGLILIGMGWYWFEGFVGAVILVACILNLRITRLRGAYA